MQATAKITAKQEARFFRKFMELAALVIGSIIPFGEVMTLLDELIRKYQSLAAEEASRRAATQVKTWDLAEERRAQMEKFYCSRGFNVSVPKPGVSNREFARRRKLGQELFFRFATKTVSYEAFMAAVGQSTHWTVVDEINRAKIGWESAAEGYWFWAEVAESCPRLGTSWNDLTSAHHLLALEEYVVVWWAYFAETGRKLDVSTWSWLRTPFGQCALSAVEDSGVVCVDYCHPELLAQSFDYYGGRVTEVAEKFVA